MAERVCKGVSCGCIFESTASLVGVGTHSLTPRPGVWSSGVATQGSSHR